MGDTLSSSFSSSSRKKKKKKTGSENSLCLGKIFCVLEKNVKFPTFFLEGIFFSLFSLFSQCNGDPARNDQCSLTVNIKVRKELLKPLLFLHGLDEVGEADLRHVDVVVHDHAVIEGYVDQTRHVPHARHGVVTYNKGLFGYIWYFKILIKETQRRQYEGHNTPRGYFIIPLCPNELRILNPYRGCSIHADPCPL